MATSIDDGYSASVQGEKIHLSRNAREKDIDQAAVAPAGFGAVDRRAPTSLGCNRKVKRNYYITSCLHPGVTKLEFTSLVLIEVSSW